MPGCGLFGGAVAMGVAGQGLTHTDSWGIEQGLALFRPIRHVWEAPVLSDTLTYSCYDMTNIDSRPFRRVLFGRRQFAPVAL